MKNDNEYVDKVYQRENISNQQQTNKSQSQKQRKHVETGKLRTTQCISTM